MKSCRPLLRFLFLPLSTFMLLALQLLGQSESPIQGSHTNVVAGPSTGPGRAEIIPLFWKASIRGSIISVPLSSIEYFGIQTYDVDGVARVRELAITTKSQSMIRIYHMARLNSVAESTVKALSGIVEGVVGEELNVPVKVFPTTTHAHMVEYRVEERANIDTLYTHLEATMKDYYARALVSDQRDSTIRQVIIVNEEE